MKPDVEIGHSSDIKTTGDLGTIKDAVWFIVGSFLPGIIRAHQGKGIRACCYCIVHTRTDWSGGANPVIVPIYSNGGPFAFERVSDWTRQILKTQGGVGVITACEIQGVFDDQDEKAKPRQMVQVTLEHVGGKLSWRAPSGPKGVGKFTRRAGEWKGGPFEKLLELGPAN